MNTVAVNHAVAALVAALWVLPAALWQHTAGAIIHYIYLHGPLDWGMWAGLPPATICERITTVAATFWAEAHDPHAVLDVCRATIDAHFEVWYVKQCIHIAIAAVALLGLHLYQRFYLRNVEGPFLVNAVVEALRMHNNTASQSGNASDNGEDAFPTHPEEHRQDGSRVSLWSSTANRVLMRWTRGGGGGTRALMAATPSIVPLIGVLHPESPPHAKELLPAQEASAAGTELPRRSPRLQNRASTTHVKFNAVYGSPAS